MTQDNITEIQTFVKFSYQFVHEVGTLGVCGHLGLQITDVVLQVTGAKVALQLAWRLQQLRHTSFLEDAVAH